MNLQFARQTIDWQPDVVESHDLNTILGGTMVKRRLVETYGIGASFDEIDPMEIARVVSMMLDDREAYAAHRRNCLEAARVPNWEHGQYSLRRVFADLLGDRALAIPVITIEPLGATGTSRLESAKYAATQ